MLYQAYDVVLFHVKFSTLEWDKYGTFYKMD